MKFRSVLLLALAGALIFAPGAEALKPGLTGAAFLKIGVGARMAALGQAATTIAREPNQLFLNPAGIALKTGETQVTYTYNQWIAEINHHSAAVTRAFGRFGTLGVGFVSMGLSKIEADRDVIPSFLQGVVTQYDKNTGSYDYSDVAVLVGYASQVTDKLSLGAGMKGIFESIDSHSARSVAFDFGAIYRIGFHGASVGARVSNIGKDLKYITYRVPLPLIFSIGAALDLVKNEKHSLMVRADAAKPQDAAQVVFSGGEYVYNDMLFLRGAWKFNYSGTQHTYTGTNQVGASTTAKIKDTEEKYSLGAGVKFAMGKHKVSADYAYTGFGILNNVHRFSLGFELK